jgi:hypothetical protein
MVLTCGIAGLCEEIPDFEGIEVLPLFVSFRSLPKAPALEDDERGNNLISSSPDTKCRVCISVCAFNLRVFVVCMYMYVCGVCENHI